MDVVNRRGFLNAGAAAATAAFSAPLFGASAGIGGGDAVCQLLHAGVLTRKTVDRFLDPAARVWARFHPRYGYLLRNAYMRDGVDGCFTLSRYQSEGQRQQVNFADAPCRINTYGDSFTQGHQVSDGETWQEVLAAHFCEPIRNYGIGGFGVYQAYRRLLEVESTERGAPYVVLNIWGDDHYRSISPWRWLSFPPEVLQSMSAEMFHANPWDHARLDPRTGELVEKPNACPTPESLYNLCDLDFVMDTFGDDEVVHAMAAMRSGEVTNAEPLERMAAACGYDRLDLSTEHLTRSTTTEMHHQYAVRVGMKIVERLKEFVDSQGKQLMVLLSHPSGSVWHYCADRLGEPGFVDWHPRVFQDHVRSLGVPVIDTVQKHVTEFQTFRLDAKRYVDRYYIGHYNPTGNHFFAYAVKDELVDWLDPKPPAYRGGDEEFIRFDGYLPS